MENVGRNDWLVTQSLERSLDVISAINRLSIHSKLKLAGLNDSTSKEETEAARKLVTSFLGLLSDLIERASASEDKIAFGADPRLGSLARRFLVDQSGAGGPAQYRLEELNDLRNMLNEGEAADHDLLIKELAHLRTLLEQHSQADAAIVFNEI